MPAQKFRVRIKAQSGADIDEIFKANADLSTCQFRFVALGTVAGEVVGATGGSNPYPIGVLQNTPTASQNAIVRVFGKTTVIVPANASSLRPGDFLTSTGCGGAVFSGASGPVLGRWIDALAASGGSASTSGQALVNTIVPSASPQSAS